MQDDGEESESFASTDYGSLQLIQEDFEAFENMDPAAYDDYRWQLLGNARGVEHYVVKQLAWLLRLPVDEAVWNEIRDLMNLQKSVQLGGAETRKKAIRYLLGRRRYEFWHRMGRLDQEETMGRSVLPDE